MSGVDIKELDEKIKPHNSEVDVLIFKEAIALGWDCPRASILVLCSLAMRSAGPEYRIYDLMFGSVGIALWTWVSVIWRDRALIMLNTISFFMLTVALLKEI